MKHAQFVILAGIIGLGACSTTPVAVLPDGTPVVGRSFEPGSNDGSVTLECAVNQDGSLSACVVIAETPPGQGLGQAALDAAKKSRVDVNRSNSGDRVRFTTRFRASN
jgi:TonB family protein